MNMKKLSTTILILLLGILTAPAQTVFDNPDNHPYFGVRAGLDITCPGNVSTGPFKVDLFNAGAGFNAGAVYNVPVWKNLYFEPGLMLYYSTMGVDVDILDDEVTNYYSSSASVRRFGIRVPFRFGYRFDFPGASVHVFTGPQLEIGLVGRLHASLSDGSTSASDSENIYSSDSALRRTNLAWQFGAGISFARNWQVEICGAVGMLDLYNDASSFHQSNVTINLGYNF